MDFNGVQQAVDLSAYGISLGLPSNVSLAPPRSAARPIGMAPGVPGGSHAAPHGHRSNNASEQVEDVPLLAQQKGFAKPHKKMRDLGGKPPKAPEPPRAQKG